MPTPYLTDVVEVAAGDFHVCALQRDGRVSCWGQNGVGQSGVPLSRTPLSNEFTRPVWVEGLPRAVHIEAGQQHTCALTDDGMVWCWGSAWANCNDDLVPGVTIDHLPYVPRTAFAGVPRPIASYHANPLRATSIFLEPFTPNACAASATDVTCWGTKGKLDPSSPDVVDIGGTYEASFTSILKVAHRAWPVCALWQSGGRKVVSCWRENETPTEVDWPRSAGQPTDVRMGEYPLCVLDSLGELYCWKTTVFGRYWQKPPNHITWRGKKPTIAFATGTTEVCLVAQDGVVDCCLAELQGLTKPARDNLWARVGVGPHPIPGVQGAVQVTIGDMSNMEPGYGCAVLGRPMPIGAQVLCWGENGVGQLGNGGKYFAAIATAVLGATYSTVQRPNFENLQDIRTHEFDWHSMPDGSP